MLIVNDLNILSCQEICLNREILDINDVINQMDLIDLLRTFHSNTKNISSSKQLMELSPYLATLFRYKASLNRFKKIETTPFFLTYIV